MDYHIQQKDPMKDEQRRPMLAVRMMKQFGQVYLYRLRIIDIVLVEILHNHRRDT
jgi:hypothetical protein